MNRFTDIHTHILPGVDDGAADMAAACELICAAWQDGTGAMFLTPHYRGKYKENTTEFLRETFSLLQQAVAEQLPDMKLYLGTEVHFEMEAPDKIREGSILSLNGSGYVLLEFRMCALRSQIVTGVWETARWGYTPIIAHAERYDAFRKDPGLVEEVLRNGALIQMNADSILGAHGFGLKRFCHRQLKAQNVHFIASDAHDLQKRPPLLQECYKRVCKKYGQEYAQRLFWENAEAVIHNEML